MTDRSQSITPSSELVEKWYEAIDNSSTSWKQELATQAARWGADQQLDQDAKWLDTNAPFSHNLTITPSGGALRQVMRPKPPSLKEQALEQLKRLEVAFLASHGGNAITESIRRALEALPE